LFGQPLLNLKAAREDFDDPGQLAQPDDRPFRDGVE